MTNAADLFSNRMPGLPDPELDRQFYTGVPARRFAAWMIDFVIVVAMSLIVIPVLGILTLGLGFFAIPFVYMAISYVYRVATIANRSATWGMRLMGIELRRADGSRFDLAFAAVHVALYTGCVVVPVLLLGNVLTALTTRYQQTLQDLALRTTAINRPEE